MLLLHIWIWVFSFGLVCAEKVPIRTPKKDVWEHNSVVACASYLNKLSWEFEHEHRAYYALLCEYTPAFGSWALCVHDMLEDRGQFEQLFDKSLDNVRMLCSYVSPQASNITSAQYYNALGNATSYLHEDFQDDQVLSFPVRIRKDVRQRIGNAFHGYAKNLDISNLYGSTICYYFFGTMLLLSFLQYLNYNVFNLALLKIRFINYFRAHFIIPTLLSSHADYFSVNAFVTGLLPTTFESLLLTGYLSLHTLLLFINYEFDPYYIVFDSKAVQVARYFGDRTGIMAFKHFPLIILFSTRNNLFEYLTGFSYSTFITFHKWIGRMMVLDFMLHGISYFIYALLNHSFISSNKLQFWRFGVVALILGCLIFLLSFGFLRKHYYETFLYSHIILAILFFVSCWRHVSNLGWKEWIVAAMAIWIFERITRVLRLIAFGFPVAKLQIVLEDMIVITVPNPHRHWSCKPGQYAFAYFMDPVIFWQSHPFTVMSSEREVVIVMKAKKGSTKFLLNKVMDAGGRLNMRISLEGPYGSSAPTHRYDNILFLTGGSGIPGPLVHAIDMAKTVSKSSTKTVKLVIMIRQISFLQPYKAQLLQLIEFNIQVDIYVTRGRSEPVELDNLSNISSEYGSRDSVSILSEDGLFEERLSLFATFHEGRPNVKHLIDDSVLFPGSLSILSCGPPAFVDDVRNFTAEAVLANPDQIIEYFEEYQCW